MKALFTELEMQVIEKAQRIVAGKAKRRSEVFSDPDRVKSYLLRAHAVNEPDRESFRVLFMDNQHRLIADESVFFGTIDASPVYPRVVVQKSLEHNAAAIILSHNHPSGIPEPSMADKNITKRLQDALALVDIRVLDHIVVGDEGTVSFAERGWI